MEKLIDHDMPAVVIPQKSGSREESLAKQFKFSDGSVTRWDLLCLLRDDIATQGHLLAERRAGRATYADRKTILARLAQDKRRLGELMKGLGMKGNIAPPAIGQAQAQALFGLVLGLYELAEIGVRDGQRMVAEAERGSADRMTIDRHLRGLGEGVGREAEIVRTLIASDKDVWALVGPHVAGVPASPAVAP